MDRRRFLRDVSLYSAGATIIGAGAKGIAAPQPAPVVGVARGSDWASLVGKALDPIGSIKAFVKPGAKVAIKPNISFDRTPEQGSNTHPEILKAAVKLCLEAGAASVLIFDNTLAEKRRCYVNSGAEAAVNSIGDGRVNLVHVDDRKFVPVKIPGGVALREWTFYKDAMEADAYINIPVAKNHGLAKLTMGLKNVMGAAGGMRSRIHWKFEQSVVDLNTVIRPVVTIIDGTRILLRNGPSGGNLSDVEVKNTVIASADTVAADSTAARLLFGMDPYSLDYLKVASQRGLGEIEMARMKIIDA